MPPRLVGPRRIDIDISARLRRCTFTPLIARTIMHFSFSPSICINFSSTLTLISTPCMTSCFFLLFNTSSFRLPYYQKMYFFCNCDMYFSYTSSVVWFGVWALKFRVILFNMFRSHIDEKKKSPSPFSLECLGALQWTSRYRHFLFPFIHSGHSTSAIKRLAKRRSKCLRSYHRFFVLCFAHRLYMFERHVFFCV